jgi:S-adenosyl methyltransferase
VSADKMAETSPRQGDPVPFDTSVARDARLYDYGLGGKDNFAADRAAAHQVLAAFPEVASGLRANRAFIGRTVRYLAMEAGVRQFLDIGMGLPAVNNTHEVAQAVAPESRIVYADNDPVVMAHARALLTSGPAGAVGYIEADLRDQGKITGGAAQTLDFGQPVAVLLMAVLHLIGDEDDPYRIVAELVDAVPPGSYLVISHPAADIEAESMAKMADILNRLLAAEVTFRDQAAVARFFDGLELVEPGMVWVQQWRPDTAAEAASPAALWGGVARKP